jgi:hypothetical protein
VLVFGYGGYDAYANWRVPMPTAPEAIWLSGLLAISLLLAFSGLFKRRFDLD